MFKKLCHTVKCFGRRGCKCDDDTDHPVQPVSLTKTAVKRLQRQAMPKGMHRAKAPTRSKRAAATNNLLTPASPAGGESGDDGEGEDNQAVEEDTEMSEEDTNSQEDDQEMQEAENESQDEVDEAQVEENESHDEVDEAQAEENESQDEVNEAQAEENEVEEKDSEMEGQDNEAVEDDNAHDNDSAPLDPSSEAEDNGYDHSYDDDDVYPQHSPSIEAGDDSHDENSDGEDIYPQSQPLSEGENSGSDENSDEEQTYPPLPSPHGSSHTGNTSEVSKHDTSEKSSSDDEFHSLPSAKVSRTSLVSKRKSPSDDESSSSQDFYSLRSNYSHTGITPELSEAGLDNRPSSEHSSRVWTSGDSDRPHAAHAEYVTSSSQSWDSNGPHATHVEHAAPSAQSWDSDEPHATHAEYAASNSHSSEQSRGRRRWRSLDSQALADLERGLYGSRSDVTNNIGSKRARRDGSYPTWEEARDIRMQQYGPVEEEIAAYRARGAQYQAWIDNPNEPGCPIPPITFDMGQIFTNNPADSQWGVLDDEYRQEPAQLARGEPETMNIFRGQGVAYRYTHLVLPPSNEDIDGSSYIHYTARGIIIGYSIFRHNGPHWSEIAAGLYQENFRMNTLRHIVFFDIVNVQTGPYIRYTLYPSVLGIPWRQAVQYECARFEHGTRRYQELLGTDLGRAAAALVLGGFPRGTMRISQIITWCDSTAPQIRFQLEPFVDEPVALPEAA